MARQSRTKWKGADSRELTRHVVALLAASGYVVANADLTILAESPRIGRHRDEMRRTVARLLAVEDNQVNIKATTTEGLGFIGRGEGLAAQAVVLLQRHAPR